MDRMVSTTLLQAETDLFWEIRPLIAVVKQINAFISDRIQQPLANLSGLRATWLELPTANAQIAAQLVAVVTVQLPC